MAANSRLTVAVHALAWLALAERRGQAPLTSEQVAASVNTNPVVVRRSLGDLRRAGLVRTQRGVGGGYSLSRPAAEITLGAVLRAVDGPLAEVHGLRPDETSYSGVAVHLRDVWVAVRSSLREVLDETTVEQVLTGDLPPHVRALGDLPEAWQPR